MDAHSDEPQGTESEEPSGKGLRAQLEKALAEKAELEKKFSEVSGKVRQQELASVLSAKGVNAKVAKFIPSDVEGEDAITNWLTENADIFGFQVQVEGGKQQAAEAPSGPPVDPETVQATRRIQQLGTTSGPSRLADIEAQIRNADSDAEVNRLWAEAQKFML